MRISDWSSDVCSSDLDSVAARQEQPARSVLADRMAGVDMIGQVKINGVAPRPFDLVGPDHPARVRTLCGDVEKIAAVMLAKFGRPDRAEDRKSTRLNSSH